MSRTDRKAEGGAPEAVLGPGAALILLAEDDPDLREIITSFLEARGRRVLALETIPQPWDGLASARAKMAVIDVRWAASPGFHTLVKLRESVPDLPVVVIASFGDESVAERARALGAARIIEKPFDLEELDEALA